ncbi:hypothetical protein H4R19_001020 [Coemansia spiralis]|nr:hypothetical protein H4R19_001020 [Coemansia spiralis]
MGDSENDPPAGDDTVQAKRAQVKNACVNCQRACKKCDSERPCTRCVKQGLAASCEDSKRKPRQRGIKRGPYKKRARPTASPGSPPAPAAARLVVPQAPLYGRFSPESSDGSSPPPPRPWRPALLPRMGMFEPTPERSVSPLSILSDVALTGSACPPSPLPMPLRRAATPSRSIPLSTARFDAAHRTPPWTPTKPDPRPPSPDSDPPQMRRLSQLLDTATIGPPNVRDTR